MGGSMNFTKIISIMIMTESLCFAQTKTYEDRLSKIANQKSDQSLGTISGQNKEEMKKRELAEAYTYVSKESQNGTANDYSEFRKKHNISNYVGDDVVKNLIQSSKEESVQTEAVKLLESEKLLYESYQAYHESKSKIKDEGLKKDVEVRMDIIAKQSSTMLTSSLQKLSDLKVLNMKEEVPGPQYMASGGRVFPTLDLEQEKDLLNLRSSVLDRVQRDLLRVMAQAINQHYHKEQGETAKEEITSKAQLMAFVKVEDKAQNRQLQPTGPMGIAAVKEGASSGATPGIGQRLYRVGPPPPSGWINDDRAPTGQNQLLLDRQSGHAPPGGFQDDNRPGTGQSEYRTGSPPPGGWSD